ncbi:MAG: IS1634 family transposase [Acholeplasmatales bacterium]|jgi:transposase|nr:IS1634 family transposase [Acholeplasmatales bacterium]
MFIKYERRKDKAGNPRTAVRIVEGIRVGNKIFHKSIINFGTLELQDDREAFIKMVQDQLEELNYSKDENIILHINSKDNTNGSIINTPFNYGYRYLESIYDYLEIDNFIDNFQESLDKKIEYKLSSILKFLVFERILFPESKRSKTSHIHKYYQKNYNFSLDDVYRSLDLLSLVFDSLQTHLKNASKTLFKNDSHDKVYYDVTNYYTEIDFNDVDGLRKKGVSKEHRVDPIVGMGLFMGSNGIPLSIQVFSGNTSEQTTLIPGINKLKEEEKISKIIVVADKGLNSFTNINKLISNGDGYLFSQTIRGLKGKKYQEIINDESTKWIERKNIDNELIYKYKLKEIIIDYKYKEQDTWKQKQIVQNVLVYWDLNDFNLARQKRNEKVYKANLALNNGAYNVPHGLNEYQKEDIIDPKTNQVITDKVKKVKLINNEKIDEDEKWDGYYVIVTSELDYSEAKIRSTYGELWKIEETFRITKTDLLFRPIYHFKTEHIIAHFLICYLSLFIVRLFQYKLKKENIDLSVSRIIRVLNMMEVTNVSTDIVHISQIGGSLEYKNENNIYSNRFNSEDEIQKDYKLINHAFNIEYDKAFDKEKKFNKYLKSILFHTTSA